MATQQLKANEQIRGVQDSVTGTAANKDDDLKAWIQTLKRERKGKIEVLVTGRTGVGKSTLVNALVGKKVAEVGRGLKSKASKVTRYSVKTEEGVEIIVWDSVGLQDGTEHEYDEECLADMKEKCRDIDFILYCIDSSAKRSELGPRQRDFSAIQKFTNTFGYEFWENAVFILTRGNTLENNLRDIDVPDIERAFKERVNEWEGEIRGALKSTGIPEEIASNIPILPAGHVNRPNLPGYQFWLSGLWCTVVDHIKDSSKLDLLALNEYRLTELSKVTPGSFNEDGSQQPNRDTNQKALTGLGIGVGAAIGAGVGAAAGTIVPGVGNVVGAAVGGTVGGVVGGASIKKFSMVLCKKKSAKERPEKQK